MGHSYVGYNQVGASQENMPNTRIYLKRFTIASQGYLAAIYAYVQQDSDNGHALMAGVWSDVAGSPGDLASHTPGQNGISFNLSEGAAGPWNARWLAIPCGIILAAGSWWYGVMRSDSQAGNLKLSYDVGADKYWDIGSVWLPDVNRYTLNTSARQYSTRASVLT